MRDRRPVRRVEEDPAHPADRSTWWAQIPAVRELLDHGLDLPPGVTFLVGENGSGKSTIVEALAEVYGLNAEGGSRNARHHTRETESDLGSVLRLVRTPGHGQRGYFLRAETSHGLYTYLESLGDPSDIGRHELSHGESFLDLLQRKFFGGGFFLMDEPEAPLSFTSTLALVATLHELRDGGAQIVVATHSPLLTALPDATILELGEHGLRRSSWADLDLVRHWRSYVDRPDGYLNRLLARPTDA